MNVRESSVRRVATIRRVTALSIVGLAVVLGSGALVEEQRWLAAVALLVVGVGTVVTLLSPRVPNGVDLLMGSAAVLLAIGLVLTLFRRFDLFDILLHAYASMAMTCGLGFLLRPLLPAGSTFRSVQMVPILLLVTLSSSMLWEIWEAATGARARWGDTGLDLLSNAAGATIGALLYRRLSVQREQGAPRGTAR